ncbi:hypothetical protein C9I98_17405 [Photobacterium sanctipauli]|uniref:Uncharacterized protein n=1 Tax=Photobacterium sanctipauli TaxID=1342794 RepID=A0A2T3NPG5_9GAMM|nr:hypothetical protein [Photobacterium sanctipauli]PSW18159.1 hypothetical protein C9I98_17405 [Photobacterium sanctipauli]
MTATAKSVAEKLLSPAILEQVKKQGAVNALEEVYSKARYARFTRVKWGANFYDGLQFDDGSTISVYPTSFNKLTLIASKVGIAVTS